MQIKRLEISGFKSFVDKAVFDFPAGVTAVVGPNGCGKSNVVDAIRWVMGEQSAKNLRGRQMEDVIFGGSEARKPLGMAEVSLIFSTQDGRVPAKYLTFSEVQVTRRLYRDGESEYLLNRTPCRLMDIAELFMDTGVGARAYSIIEQGRIGMILMAKPEERRFLIEEAAGVTKYKARKQIATRKIESTRQNLLRIGDIVGEVKRQLNTLHRQAKKAERFRAVREELRGIEVYFATRRYGELTARLGQLASEVERLEQQAAALAAELAGQDSRLEELRLTLLTDEQRLNVAQEGLYQQKTGLQGAQNRLEFQRREIASLESESVRLAEELVLLQKQLGDADSERSLLELRSSEFCTDSIGEEAALARKETELEELAAAERADAQAVEESRRRLFGLMGEISQATNQLTLAAKRSDLLAERRQRSASEEQGLTRLLQAAEERAADLTGRAAAGREQLAGLDDAIKAATVKAAAAGSDLQATRQELQQSREEQSEVASRLRSLQELEAQFANYGQGVRTLMLADNLRGRFAGLLADRIEIDESLEAALEAVLGDRLQSLLPAGEGDIFAAVQYLRDSGGGRCSFLLPAVGRGESVAPPAGADSLLARLDLPESQLGLAALLRGVMLVPDLPAAVRLAKLHPSLRFVTLQGDLASGDGVVTGGSRESVEHGLIHKKREIRVLAARRTDCDERVAVLTAAKNDRETGLAAAEKELRELQQAHREAELALLAVEKDLQRAGEDVQRLKERLTLQAHEDAQLREEQETLRREMADAAARKESAEGSRSALEGDAATLQESLAARRQRIDGLRGEVTAMKVRAAALKERQESTRAALMRLEQHQAGLQQQLARQSAKVEQVAAARANAKSAEADLVEQVQAMMNGCAAGEAELAAIKSEYDAALERIRQEELAHKELKERGDVVRRQSAEAGYSHSAVALELGNLETQLRDRFRMSIAEIVAAETSSEEADEQQLAVRQAELQKLVEEFGEVNLTAIEEYQELEERYNFLATQKSDLEESMQSLQQAIQRINRTTRKRFAETFELVNEKFKEVFPRLFCGGKAELRLTNEDDLLETGLDIIVQPPGKKLQNVSLLSGGEKALTAVALIFAIFLIKPSPFCLLDEVDAPLDDANIGRFNELIREMSVFSQFILITHSKTTMAVADTLYGVTMEEPGVSRLVSVKML